MRAKSLEYSVVMENEGLGGDNVAGRTSLDFSGKEQLYAQLYDILFQDIIGGVYAVGDLIPSESELMRNYGVSRATARKAMEMLSNNGLISKRRGKGSEVISNMPANSLQRVTSYMKKNVADNVSPQKRLLDAAVVPAPDGPAVALGLPAGTPVYRLRRVRYSGDLPFYLETLYYEDGYVPNILEHDFSKESLRAYVYNTCGISWVRATQKIFSCVADADRAELLGIEEGDPLLLIERVSFDAQDNPREYVETYFRGDLYRLEIELDA